MKYVIVSKPVEAVAIHGYKVSFLYHKNVGLIELVEAPANIQCMVRFVFRNNTIERFFGSEYAFSGYDDVSNIPQEADGYIWWYQVPIKFEQNVLADEIRS